MFKIIVLVVVAVFAVEVNLSRLNLKIKFSTENSIVFHQVMSVKFVRGKCKEIFIPACTADLNPKSNNRAAIAKSYGDTIQQTLVRCYEDAKPYIKKPGNLERMTAAFVKMQNYRGVSVDAIMQRQNANQMCTDSGNDFCALCEQLFGFTG